METKRQENPDRYARLSPQPIEYMRQAMPQAEFRGFCRGNIIKYACRMGFKDSFATCAKKIEDYARWIRQSEQGKPLTWKDTDDEYYGLTDEERKEALDNLHEEIADVLVCCEVLPVDWTMIREIEQKKSDRWTLRLRDRKEVQQE